VTVLAAAPLTAAAGSPPIPPAGRPGAATTATTITGAASTFAVGDPITLSVAVTAASGTPTGSVLVSDSAQNCTATLSDGSGTCQLTEQVAGAYSFTGSYSGDSNFSSSDTSAGFDVTVGGVSSTTTILETTPDPVVGQPIMVDVSVAAAGAPTGAVTVTDGIQTCLATLSSGTGSCVITELSAADYSLTATYSGDLNFISSDTSAGFGLTVGEDSTTTGIASPTPSPVVGEPITFDVTVSPDSPGSGTPTGSVTVSDGTQDCLAPLTAGAGSCQITETAAASFTFTASYGGDPNFDASVTSSGLGVTVSEDSTTTGIARPTPSPVVGEPITFDVTVSPDSPGSGTPTGSVTVSDGTQDCLAPLTAGAGSCEITETTAAAFTFSASYGGDSNFDASVTSSGLGVTVGAVGTTTVITNAISSFVVGQLITVKVSVAASAPGSGTPSGTVTVSDGTRSCLAGLSGGTGSCHITETAAGPYRFTASYGGTTNFGSSVTSTSFAVTVGKNATTTHITGATPSPVVGQPVTVGVSVGAHAPGSGSPTGTVTISDGTRTCLAALTGGIGSCHITETAAGPYSFVATYAGSSNNGSSAASGGFGVTVGRDATATVITSTTASPVVGEPVTVKVKVGAHAPGSGTPTGTVTVSDGKRSCIADLTGGIGSCRITEPATGHYELTATYGGDGNFDASGAPAKALTVAKATSRTALELSASKVTYGDEQAERVSVTVSPEFGGTPAGTITVKTGTTTVCLITLSSAKGSCTLSAARFGPGAYPLGVTYGGSSDFESSAPSLRTLTVAKASSSTTFKLSASRVTYGDEQAEHVSVIVSPEFAGEPTGSVSMNTGTITLCEITLSSAKGSCTLPAARFGTGDYLLGVTYGGSSDFNSSAPALQSLTVAKASTSSTLELATSKVTYGDEQAERLSVTVSPEFAGTPTGKITVEENGSTLCSIRVSSAKGSCTLSPTKFRPGDYNFAASYGGDPNFDASGDSSGTVVSVSKASSSTALKLSISKVTYGHEQAERLSVAVSPEFAGTPTGSITVKRGTATLCEITLSSGKGSCTLSPTRFGPGSYHLGASYGGNGNFGASGDSARTTLRVLKAKSRTALKLSAAKVTYGHEQHERLSVTVSPEFAGTPTGSITVTMGTSTLCEITLSSAKGSCTLAPTKFGAGTYHLGASYRGSADFEGSVSAPETLTVPF
jgi:hypothetical protein